MKITILSIGNKLEDFEQQWMSVYKKRLEKYVKLKWIHIRVKERISDNELLKHISKEFPSGQIILLDEHGKTWNTEEFKEWVDKQQLQSTKEICFVFGDAYGFSKDILQKFPFHVSLSNLTFAHKLAVLVLFEQLYRVFSWKAGSPYHHD